jgi:hypothetical protein
VPVLCRIKTLHETIGEKCSRLAREGKCLFRNLFNGHAHGDHLPRFPEKLNSNSSVGVGRQGGERRKAEGEKRKAESGKRRSEVGVSALRSGSGRRVERGARRMGMREENDRKI